MILNFALAKVRWQTFLCKVWNNITDMRFWSVLSESQRSFLFFHLHCYHFRQKVKQTFHVKQRCSSYSAAENVNNLLHSAVVSWRKIDVTPSTEIPFCVEIHKQKGNEWPMAFTTKSFNTSDGQVGKTYVSVMKGLCNSYTRSTGKILPFLSGRD